MKDKLLDAGAVFLMCLLLVYLSPLILIALIYAIYKAIADPMELEVK